MIEAAPKISVQVPRCFTICNNQLSGIDMTTWCFAKKVQRPSAEPAYHKKWLHSIAH